MLRKISGSRKASLNFMGLIATLTVCGMGLAGLDPTLAMSAIGAIGLLCAGNTALQGMVDNTAAKQKDAPRDNET